jgi:hypothetical protein
MAFLPKALPPQIAHAGFLQHGRVVAPEENQDDEVSDSLREQ